MASSAAAGLLARQLKQMQTDKDAIPGISCGLVGNDIFEWEVMLMISDECKYYGGEFGTGFFSCSSAFLAPSRLERTLKNQNGDDWFCFEEKEIID